MNVVSFLPPGIDGALIVGLIRPNREVGSTRRLAG